MQTLAFWSIIDNSRHFADPYDGIKSALCDLTREEILSFDHILSENIAEACTFPLLAANFAIASYVSDESFREFRAWLISRGFEKFTKALVDIESIAEWLSKEAVDGIGGASMLAVAQDAYVEKYGDDDFLERVKFVPDPVIIQDWPEDKTEYRRRWPKLVDKFWNAKRIHELHAD